MPNSILKFREISIKLMGRFRSTSLFTMYELKTKYKKNYAYVICVHKYLFAYIISENYNVFNEYDDMNSDYLKVKELHKYLQNTLKLYIFYNAIYVKFKNNDSILFNVKKFCKPCTQSSQRQGFH